MTDKMTNLRELQSLTDQETLLKLFDKWSKQSDNEAITEGKTCIMRLCTYIAGLELDRETLKHQMDIMSQDKIRAVKRARNAETKIEALETDNVKLKQSLQAFGL